MHRNDPNDSTLQPTMKKATVKDVLDVVLYLAQAGHESGEILHVDGAPARHWQPQDDAISFRPWAYQLFEKRYK
jgi:hypothetical protein